MSEKSQRTPERSTHFNNADNIERYLHQDGHKIWGLVIYRCTYESDSAWEEFMRRFNTVIRSTLQLDNGLDMLESLSMTVFSDRSTFDDASTAYIREHFKQWTATAVKGEQGLEASPAGSQRYRYCIQVDEDSLSSILEEPAPTEPIEALDGWVNLIWKDWIPLELDEQENEEANDDEVDSIEGCRQHDVGWMMVNYQCVMVGFYYHLRDTNNWYREYRRPPEVAFS